MPETPAPTRNAWRVWKVNEHAWVSGPSLLSALRGACREFGFAWHEMLDRDHFAEISRAQWPTTGVYDFDDPDNFDLTLSDCVARLEKPGVVMHTEEMW